MLDAFASPIAALATPGFLAGGGRAGERLRSHDWARTLLGPARDWPEPLKTTLRLVLASDLPMALVWGPERFVFHNDACEDLVGAAASPDGDVARAWPALWPSLAAAVEHAQARNEARTTAPIALQAGEGERHVQASCAPAGGELGAAGVLCTFIDVTAAVTTPAHLERLAALAREEESRRLEAEALREVATDLASELDLQALVQKVTDLGTRLTGEQFGAFFYNVVSDKGEAFQLFTLSGAPREAFEKFGYPRATPVFKPTFLGQGPVRLDDVTRDARYGRMAPHQGMPRGHLPVRSYLAVPVVTRRGEVLGGLFFGHAEAAVFDARAERNAVGLAAQAAVAFDNAQLYTQAREEIRRRSVMEESLRESERRYRDLLAVLPAAVYTTDAQGRLQLHNEAAERLWGRTPRPGEDRFCGAHRLFTPQGEPIALDRCAMARLLAGEDPGERVEVVFERPDGSRRHALAHPRALHDEHGRMVGALNIIVDITERKRAESELAQTKDQLAQQVASLTQLHDLAVRLGGISELTPALEAVLETAVVAQGADMGIVWLPEPGTGALLSQVSHGFDAEALLAFARVSPGPRGGGAGNAFARGTRYVIEDVEENPDFEPYLAAARRAGFRSLHSTPIVTRSGELLGVITVHFRHAYRPSQRDMQMADVCARHAADAIEACRAIEETRASERLYRAMGDAIDYGVWVCDRDGRLTYASQSFLRLTGLTLERCLGFGWGEVLHPEDRERTLAAWQECVGRGADWDVEHRILGVDGRYHAVLARGVPVRDERGHITGWAGINLDISRLKQVENELRELDKRKNEFLATLAHELRNPLAPLRNGLEVLRLAGGNPAMAEKARAMMERQLQQMVRLVDDLLDVSRVSRGKIELRREDIDLAATLRNAIEQSQPLMDERGQQFVVSLPKDVRIMVHGDAARLAQVFGNLLNNAAKYTERGGRVELSVRMDGSEAVVYVRDNGVGIPAAMLSQVFDIFTQVDRSLEKSQGGLGIGLSIAKRLVEMHGGSIRAASDGDRRGSEFTVRLPARAEPVRQDAGAASGAWPAGTRGNCHRVLVADDNEDSASTLALMLEVIGNEVRVARDGEEAVEIAARWQPDVVFLDIGMPRLNGYDACERMRAQPWGRDAHIVALTGWGQREDRERAERAGFDRHLVKPVEPRLLEKLVAELPARDRAGRPQAA